jgi:hypothetical protein
VAEPAEPPASPVEEQPAPTPAVPSAEDTVDGGEGVGRSAATSDTATTDGPRPVPWGEYAQTLSEQRYLVLCGVLLLLVVSYLSKGRWPGGIDLWEHSAAAREFATRPLSPRHPLLSVDAPHQFQNPYLFAVGMFSRLTGTSVITAMNVASVFNLILLCVGLRLFLRRISTRKHVDFYALLFILFLWGPGAWFFSGFLHFNVFALVLPYPSTFSKGVVFLALWAHTRYLDSPDVKRLIPPLLLGSLLWLTHPVDGIFLAVGMVALAGTISTDVRKDRKVAITLAVLAASFLLAMAWPYFSLYELLFGKDVEGYRRAIAGEDRQMYSKVLVRLGPALIAVPFIFRRWERWRTDPLVVMFAGTLFAYWYGYSTQNWSYGRLISSIHVVACIILAEELAAALTGAASEGRKAEPAVAWIRWTAVGLILFGAFHVRNGLEVLPDSLVADRPYHWIHHEVDMVKVSAFSFLAERHRTYPVVISDLYTSLAIPTFGSKVVAYARTQAFVPTDQRGGDMGRFFDKNTSMADRQTIIGRYGASLLVLTNERLSAEPETYRPLLNLGRVVSQNDRFVFVDLRQRP